MSAKVKMRCARCGKSFKSSGAKQTLCAECEVKARNERVVVKPVANPIATTTPVPAPKIVGPGAGILVPGMAQANQPLPVESGPVGGATGHGERGAHGQPRHGAHETRAAHGEQTSAHGHGAGHGAADHGQQEARRAKATHGKPEHGPRSAAPKAPREPRPARPPVPPFELTDEIRAQIEQRYLELAQPVEFDGIRTQIAGELQVPKHAVKQAVKDLRNRKSMPSWWELQSYTGGKSELERIRAAYEPHLPVPEIGIHKRIATELGIEPTVVYHGIKRIRAEMRLPQYNPPEAHGSEQPEPNGETPAPVAETALNAGGSDAS